MTLPALSLLRLESYDTQVANQTASLVSVGANSMYKPLIVPTKLSNYVPQDMLYDNICEITVSLAKKSFQRRKKNHLRGGLLYALLL
jgi:hypothetical protein